MASVGNLSMQTQRLILKSYHYRFKAERLLVAIKIIICGATMNNSTM